MSFGASDLVTTPDKVQIITEAEKAVLKAQKLYDRGVITDPGALPTKCMEACGRTREAITKSMMHRLEHDVRDNSCVRESDLLDGAFRALTGGVRTSSSAYGHTWFDSQASGEIIETRSKQTRRLDGTVGVLQLNAHGARKGLADTAERDGRQRLLTRKLADVCQNCRIIPVLRLQLPQEA